MNHTAVFLATATMDTGDIVISKRDRERLRRLAAGVARVAARPCEAVKRDLWRRHNRLEPTRPLVFCDPENGWTEIIPDSLLECEGALARTWEMRLRKEIFWGESMGDDRVVPASFPISHVAEESDWGMHERKTSGGQGGSYVWEAPLKSYDDIEKLHYPVIRIDHHATQKLIAAANDVFGDLLAVEVRSQWWWSLGMTWALVNLRGLEQIIWDTYDHPEDLHRLMGFLRDGTLAKLDFLEMNGLLSLNNDAHYVGSGGFGVSDELPSRDFDGKHVRARDIWGFCESQETITFSPEMFGEFIFPYQLPILERFGLNCYGCCEPLDKRWPVIKNTPRLRRVSVSPWADWEKMAGTLGEEYIYSLKPHPTDLAVPVLNEDRVRRDLRRVMEITRGCRLEIIMKDNHTIGNNPRNVTRWCQIARELAEKM